MLGIGIVTYNRIERLREVIDAVLRNTAHPYCLMVADDGSSDGTVEYVIKKKVPVVGRINKGIAWNKNRALYTLRNYAGAENIIILEDDTLPNTFGWEQHWLEAARKSGYSTYAHPKMRDQIIAGSGTVEDPYACIGITSQCSVVSMCALDTVGYFDTRFKGYGVEDGEWSTRLRGSGFGTVKVPKEDGNYIKANVMIDGGVHTLDVASYRNNDEVTKNRDVFKAVRNDPIPRNAWQNDTEKDDLLAEIESGLIITPLFVRSIGERGQLIGP
ncbi:glycosyltransferase family 2 protein [Roseomonas chloroacetimidivorans]|uniref:glycosyltransferase family 2 protein n=1 Tax=Roseomonas chloroacetimidivorans TaxID=1766656 RepID=UPI003C777376